MRHGSRDGRIARGAAALGGVLALACGAVVVAAGPAAAVGPISLPPANSCGATTPQCVPAAADDTFNGNFGTKTVIPGPGVLANDFGPDSTTIDVIDSSATSDLGNATITFHKNAGGNYDGGFTYTPDPATPFSGDDTFSYTIQDDQGDQDFGIVTIHIPIVVNNDSYTVTENHHLVVNAPGVLANDSGADPSSIVLDPLSANNVSVNDDSNGAFDYIPPQNFVGTDSFTYSVDNYNGDDSGIGTVTIHVVPPAPPPPPKPKGYWMVGTTGTVYPFGQVRNYGNASSLGVTHIEPTPTRKGYWVVDGGGHVFAFGDAKVFGGVPKLKNGEIVSSLSSTLDGKGYWLFTNRGRVINRGDAKFFGDMHAVTLNGPVVGSSTTPTGNGYYMVGSDGGIFTFGDAHFFGSMGGAHLNKPVNGLVPTSNNRGYWLVASDGGIFAFGNAGFHGSMGGTALNRPIIGMVPYGNGYLMVSSDGGIFDFSNLPFLGSLGADPPPQPIVGVAAGG